MTFLCTPSTYFAYLSVFCSNYINCGELQIASQTPRQWRRRTKGRRGVSVGSSCGWRLRDSVAVRQIPSHSPSVLWSTSVWRPAGWDLNNGGHSGAQINSSPAPTLPPPPLLSQHTPSPSPPPPWSYGAFPSPFSSVLQISQPPLPRRCCSPSTLDKLLPALRFSTVTPVIILLLTCTMRALTDVLCCSSTFSSQQQSFISLGIFLCSLYTVHFFLTQLHYYCYTILNIMQLMRQWLYGEATRLF